MIALGSTRWSLYCTHICNCSQHRQTDLPLVTLLSASSRPSPPLPSLFYLSIRHGGVETGQQKNSHKETSSSDTCPQRTHVSTRVHTSQSDTGVSPCQVLYRTNTWYSAKEKNQESKGFFFCPTLTLFTPIHPALRGH